MRTDVKRRGWTISAEGNDLADRFLESVFFTGNGRMGARGYPAYRPIRRPLDAGLFLAGFYDRISDSTELTVSTRATSEHRKNARACSESLMAEFPPCS